MSKSLLKRKIAGVGLSLIAAGSIINGINLPSIETQPVSLSWNITSQALATTSGGRSRGGSFGDDQPAETQPAKRSSNRSSDRSYSESNYSRSSRYNNDRYDNRNTNNGGSSIGDALMFFMFLIFVVYLIKSGTLKNLFDSLVAETDKQSALAYSGAAGQTTAQTARTASRRLSTEITNNTVTVTQVQVAMLAQARHVQQTLNKIAEETDLSDSRGLTKSLRETVVALLRSPETWTHASAQSKTVKTKQAAKERFESLSIEERSKFDVESLSNVEGKVKKQAIIQREQESASYIVVTLLVGTAHDNPILDRATSTEELKAALKKLGSITPDYLMVYEVLWSPQDESDSLTDDELLLNYPSMFQIS